MPIYLFDVLTFIVIIFYIPTQYIVEKVKVSAEPAEKDMDVRGKPEESKVKLEKFQTKPDSNGPLKATFMCLSCLKLFISKHNLWYQMYG